MQKKIGPELTRVVVMSVGLNHLTVPVDADRAEREKAAALASEIGQANLVVDVSGLTNPHYVDELRPLTGRDEAVVKFLENDLEVRALAFNTRLVISALLPGYIERGNSHGELKVVFRCTGGKHRSQYFAETMADFIRQELSRLAVAAEVVVRHVLDEAR